MAVLHAHKPLGGRCLSEHHWQCFGCNRWTAAGKPTREWI